MVEVESLASCVLGLDSTSYTIIGISGILGGVGDIGAYGQAGKTPKPAEERQNHNIAGPAGAIDQCAPSLYNKKKVSLTQPFKNY